MGIHFLPGPPHGRGTVRSGQAGGGRVEPIGHEQGLSTNGRGLASYRASCT